MAKSTTKKWLHRQKKMLNRRRKWLNKIKCLNQQKRKEKKNAMRYRQEI